MKRILLFLFSWPMFVMAQDKTLMAQGSYPDLYLSHTVAVKENFYSIGRLYNIGPKEIARLNNLQMEKGLNLNQVIKIPLTTNNFYQSGNVAADEVLVPLYCSIKDKEGLYRVSSNFNKVPLETLKKWNHLKTDAISSGTKLIVGFLKVKKDQSAFAAKAGDLKNEISIAPVTKITEKKPVVVDTPFVKTNPPVVKIEEKVVVKTEDKPVPVKKENAPVVPQIINNPANDVKQGGVFKNIFDAQNKGNALVKEEGVAGLFKSSSGWSDGKYYCLHNSASVGTIIKITNTATGKFVYAKVLDIMPDIKLNNGLLIRISNAAASELGSGDTNFTCTLNYSK